MRVTVLLTLLIGNLSMMVGCTGDDVPLFYKIIKTNNYELRWYYYSRITSDSPDYVDIKKGGKVVTVCKSFNLFDVNIINEDTVRLVFIDKPMLRGEAPLIVDTAIGLTIIADTINYRPVLRQHGFKQQSKT